MATSTSDVAEHMKKDVGLPATRGAWHPLLDLRLDIDRAFDQIFSERPFLGRRLSVWNPFAEIESAFGPTRARMMPRADVEETDEAYIVTLEVPGITEKDIDIELGDEVLTVKGEKKTEREEKEKNYHLTERGYGRFQRSFRLPDDVDAAEIEAAYDKGVLTVTLPRKAKLKAKARKIMVKTH